MRETRPDPVASHHQFGAADDLSLRWLDLDPTLNNDSNGASNQNVNSGQPFETNKLRWCMLAMSAGSVPGASEVLVELGGSVLHNFSSRSISSCYTELRNETRLPSHVHIGL